MELPKSLWQILSIIFILCHFYCVYWFIWSMSDLFTHQFCWGGRGQFLFKISTLINSSWHLIKWWVSYKLSWSLIKGWRSGSLNRLEEIWAEQLCLLVLFWKKNEEDGRGFARVWAKNTRKPLTAYSTGHISIPLPPFTCPIPGQWKPFFFPSAWNMKKWSLKSWADWRKEMHELLAGHVVLSSVGCNPVRHCAKFVLKSTQKDRNR